jgi:hypothetical protein
MEVVDSVCSYSDNLSHECIIGVYLDQLKAFYTVNHDIL